MTRHHVISTTGCDVFFKMVTQYQAKMGTRFDSMVITYDANCEPVYGATLRDAKSGCEMHRRAGQEEECWCCGFDEQLQFISRKGAPLAHADYRLTLASGETWTGTTDALGHTSRITSKQETLITQVAFLPRSGTTSCCSAADQPDAIAKLVIPNDIKTTEKDFGTSVKKIVIDDKSRPMTQGEINMAWMVFQDAIDYSRVKVHAEPYLWFGLQPKNVAMTPNGEIYFHESRYRADFAKGGDDERHWFIHEMTHVWQYQLGYPVALRGAVRLGLDYQYTLSEKCKLSAYNMEAQGSLLADYFVVAFLDSTDAMTQQRYNKSKYLYERVLNDFFKNRKSPNNLPGNDIDHDPVFDIP